MQNNKTSSVTFTRKAFGVDVLSALMCEFKSCILVSIWWVMNIE